MELNSKPTVEVRHIFRQLCVCVIQVSHYTMDNFNDKLWWVAFIKKKWQTDKLLISFSFIWITLGSLCFSAKYNQLLAICYEGIGCKGFKTVWPHEECMATYSTRYSLSWLSVSDLSPEVPQNCFHWVSFSIGPFGHLILDLRKEILQWISTAMIFFHTII